MAVSVINPHPHNPDYYGPMNKSWGRQVIEDCGSSIVVWLTKVRPGVTYAEAKFIMANEGYQIDEATGIVTPDPTKLQVL